MGTGSPNPAPGKSKEQLQEIPLSWFVGFGKKNEGILVVIFSQRIFEGLGELAEELKTHIEQYGHYMGNRLVDGRPVEYSSEIKDAEAREIVELAERRIKEITGFSAEKLFSKAKELTATFRGKTEAPIVVELY